MTVKNLIEELQKLDSEMEVCFTQPMYEYKSNRIGDIIIDFELKIEQGLQDENILVIKSLED